MFFIINIFTCWSAETEHRLTGCVTPSNSCSQAWTEGRGCRNVQEKGNNTSCLFWKQNTEMLGNLIQCCFFLLLLFIFPFVTGRIVSALLAEFYGTLDYKWRKSTYVDYPPRKRGLMQQNNLYIASSQVVKIKKLQIFQKWC